MIECGERASVGIVDGAMREAITLAAAFGFVVGGLARLGCEGLDIYRCALGFVALPLGAIASAVIAGVVINLVTIPALIRCTSERRLPVAAYGAAGALCWIAAFTGAFTQFGPATA